MFEECWAETEEEQCEEDLSEIYKNTIKISTLNLKFKFCLVYIFLPTPKIIKIITRKIKEYFSLKLSSFIFVLLNMKSTEKVDTICERISSCVSHYFSLRFFSKNNCSQGIVGE